MKLSAKNKKTQKSILDALKKNIPLVGLLAGAMAGCQCTEDNHDNVIMGGYMVNKGTNATETTTEEPSVMGAPSVVSPSNTISEVKRPLVVRGMRSSSDTETSMVSESNKSAK